MANTVIMQKGQEEQELKELGLKSTYDQYILLERNETEYNQIRHGINIKFDIYKYFQGQIKIKPKKETATIGTRTYKEQELYNELEARLIIMKKRIKAEQPGGLTEMRGSKDGTEGITKKGII